jgi:tetratricopeptide (TPR) repeat protein
MALPNEFSQTSPPGDGSPSEKSSNWQHQDQLDFDIEFYGQVLKRNQDYLDVLRCQGQLLSRKGLHQQALEVDRRLVKLAPGDGVAHYNLGCSLALVGCSSDAIDALRQALLRGYNDYEYLETDRDLDSLRDTPAYLALLREFGIGGS